MSGASADRFDGGGLGVVAWILTARHVGRVPVLALSWRIVVAGW